MPECYIVVNVPENMLKAVYAVLAGTALASGSIARGSIAAQSLAPVEAKADEADEAGSVVAGDQAGKVDKAGTVFDPARHTGSIVKSGLWRLKAGVPRGPGEDVIPETAGTPNGAVAGASPSTAGTVAGGASAAVDDDDEFAAFTAAAGASIASTTVKARTWTDADLSKLTNQAAQKLGSPLKVKETIAKYSKAGETPHSRNIPEDKREAFASELETVAGIEFAG